MNYSTSQVYQHQVVTRYLKRTSRAIGGNENNSASANVHEVLNLRLLQILPLLWHNSINTILLLILLLLLLVILPKNPLLLLLILHLYCYYQC